MIFKMHTFLPYARQLWCIHEAPPPPTLRSKGLLIAWLSCSSPETCFDIRHWLPSSPKHGARHLARAALSRPAVNCKSKFRRAISDNDARWYRPRLGFHQSNVADDMPHAPTVAPSTNAPPSRRRSLSAPRPRGRLHSDFSADSDAQSISFAAKLAWRLKVAVGRRGCVPCPFCVRPRFCNRRKFRGALRVQWVPRDALLQVEWLTIGGI